MESPINKGTNITMQIVKKIPISLVFLLVLVACATSHKQEPKKEIKPRFDTAIKQLSQNGQNLEQFGYAVALSGDLMVVGAPFQDEDINGDDTLEMDVGAAYLLGRDSQGDWNIVKKLVAKERGASDLFGTAVAMSGDTVVVGALYENHDTNGDGDKEANVGAAYVFERDYGGKDHWGEVTKLMASDGAAGDRLGKAVAISGNTIVVGAYLESHDHDQNGIDEANAGAAYVFERNRGGPNAWGEVKKLVAHDGAVEDNFGYAVSISKNTIVVGAHFEDHDGDNNGDEEESIGAAYIFGRNQGGIANWGEVKKLTAKDGSSGDHFGISVAINDDTLVVGAYLDNFDNTDGLDMGTAYIFQKDQGGTDAWGELQKLVASDSDSGDRFGYSVAIHQNLIVIGAYLENHDTNNDDLEELNPGAAYIFEYKENTGHHWQEIKKLIANDGTANESFGFSVAVSHQLVGIGLPLSDNINGRDAGEVYLYK